MINNNYKLAIWSKCLDCCTADRHGANQSAHRPSVWPSIDLFLSFVAVCRICIEISRPAFHYSSIIVQQTLQIETDSLAPGNRRYCLTAPVNLNQRICLMCCACWMDTIHIKWIESNGSANDYNNHISWKTASWAYRDSMQLQVYD